MVELQLMAAKVQGLNSAIDAGSKEKLGKALKQKRPFSDHAEQELSRKVAELAAISDQITLKTELHKIKDEEQKRQVEQADSYWRWIRMLEVCGVGLSFYGFRWWYTRIQRFQDTILRKEINRTLAPSTELIKKYNESAPRKIGPPLISAPSPSQAEPTLSKPENLQEIC